MVFSIQVLCLRSQIFLPTPILKGATATQNYFFCFLVTAVQTRFNRVLDCNFSFFCSPKSLFSHFGLQRGFSGCFRGAIGFAFAVIWIGAIGFARGYRKSARGPPPLQDLRQLGSCSTLRFKPSESRIKQRGPGFSRSSLFRRDWV